ncbi:MAG: PA domain-containing protein [Pseudomonadota bacterium]
MKGLSMIQSMAVAGLTALLSFSLQAQMLQVDYSDPPNFGFNDNTPADPAPGNSGTTLGEQRRAAFDKAMDIWSSRLDGNSLIRVNAFFEDIGCGDTTTLGLGGSLGLTRNFVNAPQPDTNYPISVAAALRGQIYAQFDAEIQVRFNFRIDSEPCAETLDAFWYGLDPLVPPPLRTASFLELALHELGHGLGFQSLTDREDRTFFGSPPTPDVMSGLIFDVDRNASWRELTPAQRVQSATSGDNLVFTGERTNLRAAERLLPPGRVILDPAGGSAQTFVAWVQGYAPFLPLEGLDAELALAQGPGLGPEAGDPWHRALACEPLDNGSQVSGKLVLVRRGECFFATKWQNVFDAGGAGIIIVDNQLAGAEGAIERDFGIAVDRNLPIPIWMVSDQTGSALRAPLQPSFAAVHLGYNTQQPPRGTNQGVINLQASTENTDSNVSHFATSLAPRSLMNPTLSNVSFGGDLDQVPELLYDIGWPDASAKQAQYSGNWFNPNRGGEGCQLTFDGGQDTSVLTCYLYNNGDQFWLIGNGTDLGDRYEFNEMVITSGADYGAAFDPDAVTIDRWVRIVMRPVDCSNATFECQPDFDDLPDFSSQMTRITAGSCNVRAANQLNRTLSGNYFDVDRGGEGIQLALEANGLSWVITFYTYLDGDQVWMIGSGSRAGNTIAFDDVILTRGGDYGTAFDPDAIELIPFGRFDLEFTECNDITLQITSNLPQFSSDTRTLTRIVPRECT